jgi:uncharacterized protein YecE (DUF72 family)
VTTGDRQARLFGLPPQELEPAEVTEEQRRLAAAMPAGIRFGTMSWTYAGWRGIVYGRGVSQEAITRHGLTAFTKHPLFRAVEIDRTYYEPLAASVFAGLARQTPDDFRFVVKAHEVCSVARFPTHARYGKLRGEVNARYLDPSYAADHVVGPVTEGLGAKLGALLFQFPPVETPQPRAFAQQLHNFLRRLPKAATYAVELRNTQLLTPEYGRALADAGAVHCHNAWTSMPDVLVQARLIPPAARSPLVVRWLLRRGDPFERAEKRFQPFDRLVSEDAPARDGIARLAAKADQHGVPCLLLVANHAEGSAPPSIVRLADAIRSHRERLARSAG